MEILYNKKNKNSHFNENKNFEEILKYKPAKDSFNDSLGKKLEMWVYQLDEDFYSVDLSYKDNFPNNYLISKKLNLNELRKILHKFVSLQDQDFLQKNIDYKQECSSISRNLVTVKELIISLPYESSILDLSRIISINIKKQESKSFHFYADGLLDVTSNKSLRFTFNKEDEKMFFIQEKLPIRIPDSKNRKSLTFPKIEKLILAVFKNQDYERKIFEHSLNIILRGQSQISKTFFIFRGEPNTGKSLISNLLVLMFPSNCTWSTSTNKLSGNFENKNFVDKELLLIADSEERINQITTEKIKKLTGGDAIEVESKFVQSSDPKYFSGSILMTSNYDLSLPSKKVGISERMMIIPFLNNINLLKIFEDDKSFKRTTKILPKDISDMESSYISLDEIHVYKQKILNTIKLSISLSVIDEEKSRQNDLSKLSDFDPIEAFVKKFITPVDTKCGCSALLGKKRKFSISDIDNVRQIAKKEGILYKLYLAYMYSLNYQTRTRTVQGFRKELELYFLKDNNFEDVSIKRTPSYNFKITNVDVEINEEVRQLLLDNNI